MTTNGMSAEGQGSLLDGRRMLLGAILIAVFIAATGVRLYRLDAAGMLVERDFRSATIARDFYFNRSLDVEPWRRELAGIARSNQPIREPPVTEWLVSLIYSATGKEDIQYARLLTSFLWLAGGFFLYRITRSLVSTDGAVFALIYYLFAPMSVLLSRSFQPDALMMLLFLMSLCWIVRYHQSPSRTRLGGAALVTAVTLLIRPLVIFGLVGAFVMPLIQQRGLWKGAFDRDSLFFASLSVLPSAAYYGYGAFVTRTLATQVDTSFSFHLFLHGEYWKGWFFLAQHAVGVPVLIAAFVGLPWLRTGLARSTVVGLAVGYLVFGLLFTMHIHTHGYYHAQLIPLAGIAASPVVALLVRHDLDAREAWLKLIPPVAATAIWAMLAVQEVKAGLNAARYEAPVVARKIGQLVQHSSRVVFVARYYGAPLQYLGELSGAYWPRSSTWYLHPEPNQRELSVEDRLQALPFEPEYFVVTDFNEFQRHHRDLAAYLTSRCVLKAETDDYIIYERCSYPSSS